MFMHNKKMMYTVRVGETNPALANLMLEQFGGPQGELAAAMRYFTQGLAETDPGCKDLLLNVEHSHRRAKPFGSDRQHRLHAMMRELKMRWAF